MNELDAELPDPSIVMEWLRIAEGDLKLSQIAEREGLFEQACFHAQQSAEKHMKALLVARGIAPAKTHELPRLYLDLLRSGIDLGLDAELVDRLSRHAVAPRYPGLAPEKLGRPDALQAIADAGAVKLAVEKRLRALW